MLSEPRPSTPLRTTPSGQGFQPTKLRSCQHVILNIPPNVILGILPNVILSILPNVILSGVEGWRVGLHSRERQTPSGCSSL
jgi:hypothetical protein